MARALNSRAKASANGRAKRTTPTNRISATVPPVYSYRRFSNPKQKDGRSEDRQDGNAERWAEAHGYSLDTSLKVDRGRSAFHGHHRTKGHLGEFLNRVQAGDVPRGSILLIEEVRRLSREGSRTALETTVFKLFNAGITIQFLNPELAFNSEIVDQQPGMMSILSFLLDLAYQESKQKSDWGKDAWNTKRKYAREKRDIQTAMCPEWLAIEGRIKLDDRIVETGKFKIIPSAAKAIELMFRLKEERLGYKVITKRLTAAPWSPPPKKKKGGKQDETTEGWKESYVKKTLRNRAVIGEYQPHRKINGKRIPDGDAIRDYFPAVVDVGLFNRVQRMLSKTLGMSKGGRNGKASNVLQHLCKCAYCGGPMHWKNDGEGRQYLFCSDGSCDKSKCHKPNPAIRYEECETAVIDSCRRLRPEQILPRKDEQTKLVNALRQKVQRAAATLEDIRQRIINYGDQIGRTENAKQRDDYERRILKLRTEEGDADKQLIKAQSECENAERDERGFEKWQADIESLHKALGSGNVEVRQRLNAHLREFIDRIEVFTHGFPADYDGDDFGDYFYAVLANIEHQRGLSLRVNNREFVPWVVAQQMTKRGRFLRVHWNLSAERLAQLQDLWGDDADKFKYIDVVPEGSVAGHPDVGPLWDQFRSKKKRTVR